MKTRHLVLAVLVALALVVGPASAELDNELSNGDFHDGLTGWAEYEYGGAYFDESVVDGHLEITLNQEKWWQCFYYTTFRYEAGQPVIINYSAAMIYPPAGSVGIRIAHSGDMGGAQLIDVPSNNNGVWSDYSYDLTETLANKTPGWKYFGFYCNSGETTSNYTLKVDDVYISGNVSVPAAGDVDFSSNVTSGASPLDVNLYSTATGPIDDYIWHVTNPDGTTLANGGESQLNVTCVQSGSYDVELGIKWDNGTYSWVTKNDYLTVTTAAFDLSLNVTDADVGEPVGASLAYIDLSTVERIEYSATTDSLTSLEWQKFKKITGSWYKWSDTTASYSIASNVYDATHPSYTFTRSSDDLGDGLLSFVRVQIYSTSALLYMEQVNLEISDSDYYYGLQVFIFDARYSSTLLTGSSIEIHDLSAGTTTAQLLPSGTATLTLISGHQYNLTAYKTGFVNQSTRYSGIGPGIGQVIFSLSPYTAAGSGNITVRFQVVDTDGRWIAQPGVGIVRNDTNAENVTTGTQYGIASFIAPADVEHEYYVWKSGYLGATGTFNSSTDLIITVNLTAGGIFTPTPTVPTVATTTAGPTMNLSGDVDWRRNAEAREQQAWNLLSIFYYGAPILGLLAFLALFTNLTDMIRPKRRK